MTTTSEHTGTARYLAPELASNDAAVYPTTSSDVYALGCLGLEVGCLLPVTCLLLEFVTSLPYSSYIFKNHMPTG